MENGPKAENGEKLAEIENGSRPEVEKSPKNAKNRKVFQIPLFSPFLSHFFPHFGPESHFLFFTRPIFYISSVGPFLYQTVLTRNVVPVASPRRKEHLQGVARNNRNFCKTYSSVRTQMKQFSPPPTPHTCKNYLLCLHMAQKSLKIKGFLQKIWQTNPKNWHTNHPLFMPHEPFLLGVGGGLQFVEQRITSDRYPTVLLFTVSLLCPFRLWKT